MSHSRNVSGSDSILSPQSFTKCVRRLIQKQEPTVTISVPEALSLVIRKQGNEEYKAFLGNIYTDYQQMPSRFDEIAERYVQATCAALRLDPTTLNVNRLVPVIKDWGFVEQARKTVGVSGTPDDEIAQVFERYNDSLVVLYAEDSQQTIQYPAWETVAKAGLELAGLRTLAVNNLRRMLPKIETISLDRNLHAVMAGGSYEASLMLIDSFWKGRRIKVDGDYVIAMPARGMLFVTGSTCRQTIPHLRTIATRAQRESAYPLTDQLFIYDGAKFVEYDK